MHVNSTFNVLVKLNLMLDMRYDNKNGKTTTTTVYSLNVCMYVRKCTIVLLHTGVVCSAALYTQYCNCITTSICSNP